MSSPIVIVLVIVVAGVLAWLLRRASGGSEETTSLPQPGTAAVADPDEEGDEDEEGDSGRRLPITAEGVVFLPDREEVRLIPLATSEEAAEWVRDLVEDSSVPYQVVNRLHGFPAGGSGAVKPGTPLSAGDFTAARVKRGGGDDPWRLETIGRDGDFGYFPFTFESGAVAALKMLNAQGIVVRPLDEAGEPIPPSSEDWEEARRRYEETERQLALDVDPDEPSPPMDWSSRR